MTTTVTVTSPSVTVTQATTPTFSIEGSSNMASSSTYLYQSQVGAANGVAGLDENAQLLDANIPDTIPRLSSGVLSSSVLPDFVTAGTGGSASQVPQITWDSKGRVSTINNVDISILAAAVTYQLTAGGTTYSRAVSNKFLEGISVKDFGAKGDGSTDDTAAITAAFASGYTKIYIPAGTYIVTESLVVPTGVSIKGDGEYVSVISLKQQDYTTPNALYGLTSSGSLEDVTISDIGLRGNVGSQTTVDSGTQGLWGIYFRSGSMTNVHVKNVRVFDWGNQQTSGTTNTSTGGGIAIGSVATADSTIFNVTVTGCEFENIANVPGIYVAGNESYVTSMAQVMVRNCRFKGNNSYMRQNYIYILGTTALTATSVLVGNIVIDGYESADGGCEINYCSGFVINDFIMSLYGSAETNGIVIRANCSHGTIGSISLTNNGTGTTSSGIYLNRFNSGEVQSNISISNFTIKDFGNVGLSIGQGSRYVTATGGNIFGSSINGVSGIAISGVIRCKISDTSINYCEQAVTLSGSSTDPINGLDISHLTLTACGQSGDSLISTSLTGQYVTNLTVGYTKVLSPVSGVVALINAAFVASTGNNMFFNSVPSSISQYNASYPFIASCITYPDASGSIPTYTKYGPYAQGAISLQANGTSNCHYTIGTSWGSGSIVCVPGQRVVAVPEPTTSGEDYSGIIVTANAKTDYVAVEVFNPNPDTYIDAPAANWYIYVFNA